MATTAAEVDPFAMPKIGQEAALDPQMQAMLAMCMGGAGVPPTPEGMGQAMQTYMQMFQQYFQQGMQPPQQGIPPGAPGAPSMALPGMMPTPFMPPAPTTSFEPTVNVSVEGMKFQYQLTEEDLQKVFGRYGKVRYIRVDDSGSSAKITFTTVQECQTVMADLDGKVLNGLDGTLKITWSNPEAMMQAGMAPQAMPGAPPAYPGGWMPPSSVSTPWAMPPAGVPQSAQAMTPPSSMPLQEQQVNGNLDGGSVSGGMTNGKGVRKYTCRFLIGIENDKDFQVARRIIGAKGINMKRIVRTTEAKLRLRGQGSGYFEGPGQKESPEPLQLCISCTTADGYWTAVRQVQELLRRVYDDYKQYCAEHGLPVPDLEINLSENQLVYSSGLRGEAGSPNDSSDNYATPTKEAKPRRNTKSKAMPTGAEVDKGSPGPNAPPVDVIEKLIDERNEARRSCNFSEADRIREELHRSGVALMDEPGGRGKGAEVTTWRYWRD